MKLPKLPFYARVVTLFLVLSCGMGMRTARGDSSVAPDTEYLDPLGDYSGLSQTETLRLAYEVLSAANHNYNGHRVGAMKEIRQAAKLLNVELQGNGHGHEDQSVSDARFQLAQRLLEQVRSRLAGDEQIPILDHVNKALHQLAQGLQIRAVEDEQEP